MGILCKEAVDFISKKEEGKISLMQRTQLVSHLAICRFCRAFDKQNKVLTSLFNKRPATLFTSLDKKEKEAILAALEKAPET